MEGTTEKKLLPSVECSTSIDASSTRAVHHGENNISRSHRTASPRNSFKAVPCIIMFKRKGDTMASVSEDSSLEGNEGDDGKDEQQRNGGDHTRFQCDKQDDYLLNVLDKAMDVLDKSSYYGNKDGDIALGIPVEEETFDPTALFSRSHFGHKK